MVSSADYRTDLTVDPGRPEGGAAADGRGALIALTLARAIVAAVFCGFAGVALVWVLNLGKSAGEIALAGACLSGLLSLQYFYFGQPSTNLNSPRAYAMLTAQACLAYLPLPVFEQAWVSQPSFLAGSVLLVLPLPVAWPVFAGIVASTGFAQFAVSGLLIDVVYVLVNTATAGLFVYGLTRLARLITHLHKARDELANTAVAHERLRFARDLHELLGLSLSAIAPKGALILRLLPRNPARAKQELAEILAVSRRALADVRSVARLYRETSLDEETTTFASMLAASNVELRMDLDRRELPPHMRTALAAVLREGVAYLLRHRTVDSCEIVLRQHGDSVSVDIVNDGVGSVPAGTDSGFDSLSTMVSRMEGELAIGVDDDGRFRLHITLPVTARPARGPAKAADEPRASIPYRATKLAGGLVVTVFCGLFLQAVVRLLFVTQEFRIIAVAAACLLAALVLQLAYFSRPGTRLRSPAGHLLLGLQALVVYLPWLQFQEVAWTGLEGFLAGSALLVLRPALGWSVFVAVAATVAWVHVGSGADLLPDIGFNVIPTVDLGLVTFGLTWMARTVRQLRTARQAQAEVALAQTRLRFARDLHDLLGLSLSAITLKSELAYRLILVDPAKARTELAEVLEISRHALADVRSVASGYHEMSLEEECRTAESLLTTAGLDVGMDVLAGATYRDLPPEISTALATVLREGVTNVLRHSKGERCQITIRKNEDGVLLQVVNDGVTKPPEGDQWGSGIRNMSDRVAALGGTLTAGFESDGQFELCAHIPEFTGETARQSVRRVNIPATTRCL